MKLHRSTLPLATITFGGLLALAPAAHAQEKPELAAAKVRTGANITDAIEAGYDQKLRKSLDAHAQLVAAEKTAKALEKVAKEGRCETDQCLARLAAETGARFALDPHIVNQDEIYTVSLVLWDNALNTRTTAKKVCELCAAEEVDRTIEVAVGELKDALAKPAPASAAAEPAADGKVPVEVVTEPEGVTVSVDGEEAGQTPIVLRLELGSHELVFQKEGYAKVNRTIQALGSPISLNVQMEKVAVEATPPPVEPPPEPAVAATVEPFPYTATAWGMLIGGVALGGVGTWLVYLDGEVTCDDGRGRTQCPNVYNTKGLGVAGLGVGAALIGASTMILLLDPESDTGASVGPTGDGQGAAFRLRGQW